ncbi:peptide-methionine (S)-S-oxide reductase MsrA [Caldithrix abyssi]
MKYRTILMVLSLIVINATMAFSVKEQKVEKHLEKATLGGGCFWCLEAIYQRVKGVESVISGYAGGNVENPTYEAVCTGTTGHAEVVQITFNPDIISYEDILNIFWQIHDPTQLNRQGNDIGTQYRSVIFYHNDEQKQTALASKEQLKKEQVYQKPIVTEISPLDKFYAAEKYHQNYFNNNPSQTYCQLVIAPKLKKFKKSFTEYLK